MGLRGAAGDTFDLALVLADLAAERAGRLSLLQAGFRVDDAINVPAPSQILQMRLQGGVGGIGVAKVLLAGCT